MTFLWQGAEWMERETYDMFGITFEGNRDLRRIYMPPDYTSFPLRKDFYLPDDAARSPGAGVRHVERTAQPGRRGAGRAPPDAGLRNRDGHRDPTPRRRRAAEHHAGRHAPLGGRPERPRSRTTTTSTSRSRRTRRGPSARPSSTRSATARCSSTWARSTRRRTACCASSLKLDGERVVDIDPVLGYLHRGVEKLVENADYHQTISQVDPLEYISSLFCEWAPVTAYEKLLDVEVPRRAEYIRVLSGELNRIASHSLFLGWFALDLGGLTPILWSFIERDEIVEMLAALTGQRMLFNYFRIGGVNGDLNHEFMSRLGDWMSRAVDPDRVGHRPAQRERDLRPPRERARAWSTARPRCASA